MKMQNTLVMQLEVARSVLYANVEGLNHDDSLISSESGGNNLNWIVGHLVTAYNSLLGIMGGEPIWDENQTEPYKRGSESVGADKAADFDQLLSDFAAVHGRVVEKLEVLSTEELDARAAYSPRNDPRETVGSLAALTAFHQAYHVGQTGLLRRTVGKTAR
jgi:uncharacterized damage-inducible protein DinB